MIQINVIGNGGLQLFNTFWDSNNTSQIIDELQPKHSGNPQSSIIKNLTIGKILGKNSLEELCDETKKEYFLSCNSTIHRTNYSRNMNKFVDSQQNKVLIRLLEYIFPTLKVSNRAKMLALQVFDSSALPLSGKSYEDAKWVYDSRVDGVVWGYDVLTQIINIGSYSLPVQFRLNDSDKNQVILDMAELGRDKYGISRLSFDGGFKGMDFFYELNRRDFLFYTKAYLNWIWSLCYFTRKTTDLIERAKIKLRRNYKYVDLIVEKEVDEGTHKGKVLKLRMVFIKGDKRVFLTNDFEAKPKEVYEFYNRRWKIEEMFREEKQNLGFEKPRVRNINAIRTHIMTVFLAFVFCQLMLRKFPLIKGIKLLVRCVIKQIAEIIETTKGIIIRFIKTFKYRNKLERLIL